MRSPRPLDKPTRGYVMLVVMMILVVLLSAGTYGIKAVQSEIRATAKFRKSELLLRAAEAGAAHRLAEISLMREPIAVMDEALSTPSSTWTSWPSAGLFPASDVDADVADTMQYRTAPVRLMWQGTTPPPGVQVGTKTYILEMTSFAVFGDLDDGSEAAISVGLKTWDTMPGSYAP